MFTPRFYPREHEKIWEIFRHFLFTLNSIFFCLQESINNRKCFVLFSHVFSPPFVVVRRKRVCLRFVRRLLACGCKQRWTVASKMMKMWICIGRPPTPKTRRDLQIRGWTPTMSGGIRGVTWKISTKQTLFLWTNGWMVLKHFFLWPGISF